MLGLKRQNALTTIQAAIVARLARDEPISPKSQIILDAINK